MSARENAPHRSPSGQTQATATAAAAVEKKRGHGGQDVGRGGPHARPEGQKTGPSHGEAAGRLLGERTADSPHDPARPPPHVCPEQRPARTAPRSEPTVAAALFTVAKRRGHPSVLRNPHMWGTQRAIPQVSEGAKDDGRTLRTWRRGKRAGRQTAAAAGPRSRERHPARRQDAGPQCSLAILCPVEGCQGRLGGLVPKGMVSVQMMEKFWD